MASVRKDVRGISSNHSIPAVSYFRMSSDKQECSIDDQRVAVVEYATQHNYHILREYLDEGISGWKSEERKGFQQLIADATERGDFRAVLCWDQDRFSRFDPLEANHYWFLLSQANVHLATVGQGMIDWHSLGGWLSASICQHGNAEYCRKLARDVVRGLRRRKLAGDWIGGVPFGYRLEGNRLVLGDAGDIAIVQRIFELRLRGFGYFAISGMLNAEGIPSPKGLAWSTRGVRHIVIRKTYVGDSVVGEHARGKYEHIADEESTIANTHQPIVSRETWKAAQPSSIYRASGRKGEGAALAGLLRCGRCGGPMYARTNRGCESYLCASYSYRGECGCCQVPRGPLLAAVATKLREVVLLGSPGKLEAAIQRELDRRKTRPVDDGPARRKIATLDRQIERGVGRILAVDDSLVGDLELQLLALKDQRAKLIDSLAAKSAPAPVQSAKQIASKRWELDRILATASPTAVRHALSLLIDHVRLDFQEVAPTRRGRRYAFTGGTIRLRSVEGQRLGTSSR